MKERSTLKVFFKIIQVISKKKSQAAFHDL